VQNHRRIGADDRKLATHACTDARASREQQWLGAVHRNVCAWALEPQGRWRARCGWKYAAANLERANVDITTFDKVRRCDRCFCKKKLALVPVIGTSLVCGEDGKRPSQVPRRGPRRRASAARRGPRMRASAGRRGLRMRASAAMTIPPTRYQNKNNIISYISSTYLVGGRVACTLNIVVWNNACVVVLTIFCCIHRGVGGECRSPLVRMSNHHHHHLTNSIITTICRHFGSRCVGNASWC